MFWRREDPRVALLQEEVGYLRRQIDLGREREDTLRRELVTLASSRAAAEIAYYEQVRKPTAPVRGADLWSPPDRRPDSPTPFSNHLNGGEHLEDEPEAGPEPGQHIDEDALADSTIETRMREREAARLRGEADPS